MMRLARREGYLLIDNRVAPPEPGVPKYLEAATITCHHCEKQMIRNPARVRARAHCWSCDRDICDECAVVARIHGCKPYTAIIEEQLRLAANSRVN